MFNSWNCILLKENVLSKNQQLKINPDIFMNFNLSSIKL